MKLKDTNPKRGREELGGIFTINNGWEETLKERQNETKKFCGFVIPKVKTTVTVSPSTSGIAPFNLSPRLSIADVSQSNQILFSKIKSPIRSPLEQAGIFAKKPSNLESSVEKKRGKFDRGDDSSSESDDEMIVTSAAKKSRISVSDDAAERDDEIVTVKSPMKELNEEIQVDKVQCANVKIEDEHFIIEEDNVKSTEKQEEADPCKSTENNYESSDSEVDDIFRKKIAHDIVQEGSEAEDEALSLCADEYFEKRMIEISFLILYLILVISVTMTMNTFRQSIH